MSINSQETIRRILDECRTIAVVGLSSDPSRASNSVAGYMKRSGYRVVAVNPNETSVFGEQAYPDLSAVPEKVDLVDVFRRSDEAGKAVDQAIAACDGNLRDTVRALVVANSALIEHNEGLVKELDWVWKWVSPGYTRSTGRRRMTSGEPD